MLETNNNFAKIRKHAWIVWGVAVLFYGYEFFLQISPSVMVPDLMNAFKVNAANLGNLTAFYFYSYTIMQIPAGLLHDRVGPRKLLSIAIFLCSSGALIFGIATHLVHAEMGRFLIGIGASFAVIGVFKLAANWFPTNKFALMTGLTVCIGMLGAIIAGAPLAILVHHLGWRYSMVLLAIGGFCLGVILWLVVRDNPPITINITSNENTPKQLKLSIALKYVIANKQNWLVAIYGGLMFAPTSAFAALWGVPFLVTTYGIARPLAAGAISMIFVGWAVGSPLLGWISDRIGRRKPMPWIGSIYALITMILIIYVKMPISFIYLIMFMFGLFSAGFLPAFSIIRENNPPNTSATALGFMNMMNMVGGAVLQPLIGWFLDLTWQGNIKNGHHIFTTHGFHLALLILPSIIFLSLLILPFIKDTKCQQFMG